MQTENFSTKKYRFVKMRYIGLPPSGAYSPRRVSWSGSRKQARVRRKINRINLSRFNRKTLNFRPPDFNHKSRADAISLTKSRNHQRVGGMWRWQNFTIPSLQSPQSVVKTWKLSQNMFRTYVPRSWQKILNILQTATFVISWNFKFH